MNQLINRIPDSCLLISSLPGKASRMHVELLGLRAVSKPCLVNLISKDSHLAYSFYLTLSSEIGVNLKRVIVIFEDKRHSVFVSER